MDNELIIPYLNPVFFFDKDRGLKPQYNTKFWWDFPAVETFKPWQQPAGCYFQKWQTNDTIHLQVISNAGPLTLNLLDTNGRKVKTQLFTRMQQHKRFLAYYIYQVSLPLNAVARGRYRCQITAGNPIVKTVESDWMDIAEKWAQTVLIEYSNSFYYGDAIFATPWTPSFRIEGWFPEPEMKSKDELYTDQTYNQTMVYSDPFFIVPFVIGPSSGVPAWSRFLLNWIFGCDQKYLDGYQFEKPDGAKWEDTKEGNLPYVGTAIDLQLAKRRSSRILAVPPSQAGRKLLIALNVETEGFSDTTNGSGGGVIQITQVDVSE